MKKISSVREAPVDQAGSERTEAGESALPAEESPVFFASMAGQASAGHGAKCLPRSKTTLLILKACKLKQCAFPKTFCVFLTC